MTTTMRKEPTAATGALARYLRTQRDAIRDGAGAARAGDPGAVHDMRVAVRRMRGVLRTVRPVLGRPRTDALREELRWLGAALGTVRDADVLGDGLAGAVAAEPPDLVVGPVAARIRERLASRTAAAREDLAAALDADRYAELLRRLDALVAEVSTVDLSRKRLRRLAARALRRAEQRMDAALRTRPTPAAAVPLPPGTGGRDGALHEARRAYKRARYAVEVLVPVEGRRARTLVRRLRALQDVLGAHQDARLAGAVLRDYGMRAHLDGENAFTYGLLHARTSDTDRRRLGGLDRALRRTRKRRVRAWLG